MPTGNIYELVSDGSIHCRRVREKPAADPRGADNAIVTQTSSARSRCSYRPTDVRTRVCAGQSALIPTYWGRQPKDLHHVERVLVDVVVEHNARRMMSGRTVLISQSNLTMTYINSPAQDCRHDTLHILKQSSLGRDTRARSRYKSMPQPKPTYIFARRLPAA